MGSWRNFCYVAGFKNNRKVDKWGGWGLIFGGWRGEKKEGIRLDLVEKKY
jgi:hypothetical protein